MKILIINWRDPKSPLEGGAERFTQKYAEYWVSQNHQVFWLTNTYEGSKKEEIRNGVTYLRVGPLLNGTLKSYIFHYPGYLLNSICFAWSFIRLHKIDLVIDEIHGFPFFTPMFSQARNVLLACEVAGPIWNKMFPFPINLIGSWAERMVYQLYSKSEIWAISVSTMNNIKES